MDRLAPTSHRCPWPALLSTLALVSSGCTESVDDDPSLGTATTSTVGTSGDDDPEPTGGDGADDTAGTHPYDFPNKAPELWDDDWGFLADTHPVIATEFGSFECGGQYASALIDYAAARNVSWTAWAWYPGGCDFPSLITDWAGTPSEVGQVVRTALLGG